MSRVWSPADRADRERRRFRPICRGQKTGWFYDQRDNRRIMASSRPGGTVLDLYCFAGGFAVLAARRGARGRDRHRPLRPALALPGGGSLNGVAERCSFQRGEVFAELERRPRPRGSTRDRRPAGLRQIQEGSPLRAARLSQAGAAARPGTGRRLPLYRLVLASADPPSSPTGAARPRESERNSRILRTSGAAPITRASGPAGKAYLKALTLQLD